MRIGIDASELLVEHLTGVQRSLLQLLRVLPGIDGRHEYALYVSFRRAIYAARFEARLRPLLSERVRAFVNRVPNRLMYATGLRSCLPLELTLGRCDLVHYPTFMLRPQWRGARVVTIHDLMPLTHPEEYLPDFVEDFRRLVPRAARRADTIIAVSHHTKTELVARLGVPPERIAVVHHGVDPALRPAPGEAVEEVRRRLDVPGPYVLFVGTAEPRKNLPRLVEALACCRAAGLRDVHLVLAGQSAWGSTILRTRIAELGMTGAVRLPGYIPAEDLPALYSGALAFVLPSLAEGFGMPLLEAMACGTPVVASRTTSIPEVVGDAGLLCDPEEVEDIASVLSRVLTSETLRTDLVRRGHARAAQFTWERAAKETLAVYESVA